MLLMSLVGCLCFFNKSTAQFTTYGVDFYTGVIAFPHTELTVTTLSTTQAQFTIETGTGWNYTGNVSVDSPAIVVLPYNIRVNSGDYSQRYKGIHIYSDIPISVVMFYVLPHHYYHYYLQQRFNAEFLVYPYINFAIDQYKYYIATLNGSTSLLLLVGNEDNTTITIVPTQMIEVPRDPQYFNSSTVSIRPGETYTFLLYKMQTFLIITNNDLSGTAILSDDPLTVISGHYCGFISQDQWWLDISRNRSLYHGFCHTVLEQIPPTVTWGKQFLFVPFPETPYVAKIITSEEETTVKQTCNGTLEKTIFLAFDGEWNFTYSKNNSYVYCVIESDKPILVLQLVSEGHVQEINFNGSFIYTTLSIVPPVEQYINTVTYVPLNNLYTDVYDHHYIHITTTNTNNVLLDGKPYNWDWQSFHSDNGDIIGYGTVHEFNDTLPHILRHTDITAGLSVIAYGSVNNYDYDYYYYYYYYGGEGYTYLTGMNLNNINTG